MGAILDFTTRHPDTPQLVVTELDHSLLRRCSPLRKHAFSMQKTRLFKYIENFKTKKKGNFSDKILIFFIFLL